jgi:hypothetical protein
MLVDAGDIGLALDAHRRAVSPQCCAASWAISRSRKSDIFRPEKPYYGRKNIDGGAAMILRLLSAIAAACLLFATGVIRSIQLENSFKIYQMGSAT